tara:strand:+ start:122 stop:631 length:510 start_codon:yes stop_codon:yes gene_type:complete
MDTNKGMKRKRGSNKPLPKQEKLKELFDYDEESGELLWKKVAVNKPHTLGKPAGGINTLGYRTVSVDGVHYLSHRIVWMYVYSEDPGDLLVKHKDEDASNNRIDNLYLGTRRQQRRKRGEPVGASFFKPNGSWKAQIQIEGVSLSLGYHKTQEDAVAAYQKALNDLTLT